MACALGVFTGPKVKVEPQFYQVGNMLVFGVGGGGCRGHNGVDDAQGCVPFLLDWEIFDPVSFEFPVKALVQSNISL